VGRRAGACTQGGRRPPTRSTDLDPVNAERLRLRSGGVEVLLQPKSLARRSLSFWEISQLVGLNKPKETNSMHSEPASPCSVLPSPYAGGNLTGTPRVACLGFPGYPWLVLSSLLQEVL
jgi:hypothetical protein